MSNPLSRRDACAAAQAALLLLFAFAPLNLARAQEPITHDRTQAQSIGSQRERGRAMLHQIREDIEENYYDQTYHGVNLDSHFREEEERIKQATSASQIYGILAHSLLIFDDSHTFFLPPERMSRTLYGWEMQMIGDNCYVVSVEPGSDAEAKGLKPGDAVLSIFDVQPTRKNFWQIRYLYYGLRPQPGMRVVVQSPGAEPRQLDLMAKVLEGRPAARWDEEQEHVHHHHYLEMGEDLFIWQMPSFNLDNGDVDDMMKKVGQRKALLLDLRGNSGGLEDMLKHLLGYFFDHDVKIGDIKRRKETKPLMAKTRGSNIFKGQIVVLIDSRSGSAAEIFARVIQLEHRGTVIGDRSAGAVMRARWYEHIYDRGVYTIQIIPYGVSVTDANLIMTDGQSLENVGVTPDELLLPTAVNIAAHSDPVLARAAELVGVKLAPERAGTLASVEWKK